MTYECINCPYSIVQTMHPQRCARRYLGALSLDTVVSHKMLITQNIIKYYCADYLVLLKVLKNDNRDLQDLKG